MLFVASRPARILPAAPRWSGWLAAAGDLWLAFTCFNFALAPGPGGGDESGRIGIYLAVAAEMLGLMVLRFFLLSRESRRALDEVGKRPFRAAAKFVQFLASGLFLWFHVALGAIALLLFLVISPWNALLAAVLFGRHLVFGVLNRPRTDAEERAALCYWRLTRRIAWAACAVQVVVGLAVAALTGFVERPPDTPHDPVESALGLLGAGAYFLGLGVFRLLRDPRIERFENAGRPAAPGPAHPGILEVGGGGESGLRAR